MRDKDDDFEIGSVENFGGNKDKEFSHSLLIMAAMRKCLESGSKEMREGWFNERTDARGNTIKTYIEDTRKAFVESVRSLKMVMAGDLDKKAVNKINMYLARIKTKEQKLIEYDNKVWESLSNFDRSNYFKSGQRHFSKMLSHPTLKQDFIEYELIQWRNVFAELSRLTKRKDYFKAEMFEA